MSRMSFWSCRSGNIMAIFALALIPVLGSIGVAIDYANAAGTRYRLQNAIDATALSLAHAKADLTPTQLKDRAKAIFAQNFSSDTFTTLGDINVVRGTDYITVDAKATTKTTFSRLLKVDELKVASKGKVVWGPVRVEVVMALDNTGSMAGTKLDELKKAAKKLVDTLEDVETNPGDVKIGLVPFATQVRVKPNSTNKSADWIRFPTKTQRQWVCVDWDRRGDCEDHDWRDVTVEFDKDDWNGCIQDRDQDYDTNDVTPGTSNSKKYPAVENCNSSESSLSTVRAMGWDYANIRTAIDGMTAAGNTNVTIGVQWGMSLLSHSAPYTEGVDPANAGADGKTEKVLIVLTDGDNTQNRYSSSESSINARTTLACTAAKATVTVYTIRVLDGNGTLLENCASDEHKYYDVENASELTPVFKAIADEISKLRVAS